MLRNKKSIFTCLIGILIGILLSATFALAGDPIKIIINGKTIESDVAPQMIDNRVLVPVRVISENLNCSVVWDSSNNTVVITSNEVPEITETPKIETTPIEEPKLTTFQPIKSTVVNEPVNESPPVTPIIIERYEKIVDQDGKDILRNSIGAIVANGDIFIGFTCYKEVSQNKNYTYDSNSAIIDGHYYSIKNANSPDDLSDENTLYRYAGQMLISLEGLESKNLLDYSVDKTDKVLTLIKVD